MEIVSGSRPELAALLESLMAERGVSFDQLALKSGVHRSTIYRWSKGRVRRAHNLVGLLRVARALELDRGTASRLLELANQPALDSLERSPDLAPEVARLVGHWKLTGIVNLPAELTSFVGREEEQRAVIELIRRDRARLVTLTGPPGSGKTRLARRIAASLRDAFPDGVLYVPLEGYDDTAQVVPAIARQVGLRETPGIAAADQLASHFAGRRSLLVLDNFEHLLDAAPEVVKLLKAASALVLLATSRIRLHVRGEHVYPVAPFDVPPPSATPIELGEYPAVELFRRRARAANPAAQVDGRHLRVVREICERLDGIPLAIELAAARCGEFAVDELLERFPSGLALAAAGPRDAAQRQRTLSDTIDWSYRLLDPFDRSLLARLSVFNGAWSISSAAAVCGLEADDPAFDVERGIGRLASGGMVQPEGPPGRFRLLEAIRDFAGQRLTDQAEREYLLRRHAMHYLELAEARESIYVPGLRLAGDLEQLDREYDNLRPALDWARDHDAGVLEQLAAALWPYWHECGLFREGRGWLAVARATGAGSEPSILANFETGQLLLAYSLADYGAAAESGEAALKRWQEMDDVYGQALTLLYLGQSYFVTGRYDDAGGAFLASLQHWQSLGHQPGIARCLNELAVLLASIGTTDQAIEALEQARLIYEDQGLTEGVARCLVDHGLTMLLAMQPVEAIPLLEQGLEIARRLESGSTISSGLFYLGTCHTFTGDIQSARPAFHESLRGRFDSHDYYGAAFTVLGLAALAAREGHPRQAAVLSGVAMARLERSGIVMNEAMRVIYEHEIGAVRAALGERYDAAYAEGAQRRFEHVVAELLGRTV